MHEMLRRVFSASPRLLLRAAMPPAPAMSARASGLPLGHRCMSVTSALRGGGGALSSSLPQPLGIIMRRTAPPTSAAAPTSPLLSCLLGARRSIITVDVYQPPDRSTPGDPASRIAMMADVTRAEEIAFAQFNRLVNAEVNRGTLRPGARRMKRFARHRQRTLLRRDHRRAHAWRAHKKRMEMYMNWIQYRRRRSLA